MIYTLHLEQRILKGLLSHGISCNHPNSRNCLVISPLSFWEHSEERLRDEQNISLSLIHSQGVKVTAGMHVTPQMVLAGHHSADRNPVTLDAPMFLALTYVFPETDCLNSAGHDFWLQIVTNSTLDTPENTQVLAETVEPTLIALEVCATFHCSRIFLMSAVPS